MFYFLLISIINRISSVHLLREGYLQSSKPAGGVGLGVNKTTLFEIKISTLLNLLRLRDFYITVSQVMCTINCILLLLFRIRFFFINQGKCVEREGKRA